MPQRLEGTEEILPLLDLFPTSGTAPQMSFKPGFRLIWKEILEVVLNATRRNVCFLAPPRFSSRPPTPCFPGHGLSNWGLLQNILKKSRSRIEFRKVGKISE